MSELAQVTKDQVISTKKMYLHQEKGHEMRQKQAIKEQGEGEGNKGERQGIFVLDWDRKESDMVAYKSKAETLCQDYVFNFDWTC